jgi:integrase
VSRAASEWKWRPQGTPQLSLPTSRDIQSTLSYSAVFTRFSSTDTLINSIRSAKLRWVEKWVEGMVVAGSGINKLTAVGVQKAKGRGYYGDGGGLWLQLSRLGGKSWVFRFTIHGKRREMGLGPAHTVGLAEARQRAAQLRKQVHDGIDPIARQISDKSLAAATAAKTSKTFADCAKAVIASKAPGFRNPKTAKLWQTTLETYAYPLLGTRAVGSITNDDVATVLEPIWRTKYPTAKKLRIRMQAVFDYAKAMKYLQGDNPAEWKGTLEPILGKAKHETQHYPALPFMEIGTFMEELRKREAMAARAVEFAILTAARSSEVRGALWEEINLKARLWTIPASRMKGNKQHRVPLSEAAARLLQSLPRVTGASYVFPAPRGGRFSDMALTALLRRMDRDTITIHGFRSSFKDWARSFTAYADEVSELALAHINSDATRAAYARDELLPLRSKIMAEWATFCGTVQSQHAGEVLQFKNYHS